MTYITKDNLSPVEEQQFIQEEQLTLQRMLSQFHQLVPSNFIQLETKEKNYMCSTQGWKEPVCERYIFFDNNKPVQLDIPQELMTELKISENKDKNINYPVYILPKVLKRPPTQLGITIKNKEEIFIQKPLTTNNLESELNKWFEELNNSRKQISKLTTVEKLNQGLSQENQFLKTELQGEKQLSEAQKGTNQTKINALKNFKKELEEWSTQFPNQTPEKVQEEINNLGQALKNSWNGFHYYLTENLGLQEAGNNTLDSVFTKAPNKYPELEKSIGWMLFWKSLENTVSTTPDFRTWTWNISRKSGFGYSATRTWNRTGTGTWTDWTGTATEKPLPPFELNKKLWDTFCRKYEVTVFFTNKQIAQFNQIFEDYKGENLISLSDEVMVVSESNNH